jgi:hypothetical protein
MPTATTEDLVAGAEVEVRTHFQAGWARGLRGRVHPARRRQPPTRSDGSVLPTLVGANDVRRPVHTASPWILELREIATMPRPSTYRATHR